MPFCFPFTPRASFSPLVVVLIMFPPPPFIIHLPPSSSYTGTLHPRKGVSLHILNICLEIEIKRAVISTAGRYSFLRHEEAANSLVCTWKLTGTSIMHTQEHNNIYLYIEYRGYRTDILPNACGDPADPIGQHTANSRWHRGKACEETSENLHKLCGECGRSAQSQWITRCEPAVRPRRARGWPATRLQDICGYYVWKRVAATVSLA